MLSGATCCLLAHLDRFHDLRKAWEVVHRKQADGPEEERDEGAFRPGGRVRRAAAESRLG